MNIDTVNFNMDDIIESAGHSSKGNQPKWFKDGMWYKADHMGYESLSEIIVSRLLSKSNVQNFVEYEPVKIEFDYHSRNGCRSRNFLKSNEELIPLERLYRQYNGIGLSKRLSEIDTCEKKITHTVDFIEKVTGLSGVGEYLAVMLETDALFLNEDRHTNNIAFIRNQDTLKFRFCPYFDYGLSLLSDLDAFWLDGDTDKHLLRVSAKPFGSFKNQVVSVRKLYGKQFKFSFTDSDVDALLSEFNGVYNSKILQRVSYVIKKQLREFQYN